jgi:hypothetical protein
LDLRKIDRLPVLCQMCGTKFLTRFPTRAMYCSSACAQRGVRVKRRFAKWQAMRQQQAQWIKEQHATESANHKQNNNEETNH